MLCGSFFFQWDKIGTRFEYPITSYIRNAEKTRAYSQAARTCESKYFLSLYLPLCIYNKFVRYILSCLLETHTRYRQEIYYVWQNKGLAEADI